MRTIQKQISLEPMTSRLPSVWPSYKNNRLYYFDNDSLSGRSWQYTSNWGMVPLNIVVTPKPYSSYTYDEYSAVSGCHCYGEYVNASGNPTHCYDETKETIETCVCPIDNNGLVESGFTPYYYDELCNFVLSFENLSKWYYFFNEYYNLLKQYGHCNRVYTSAEDYYNYESLTKYADQMKYGSDKETYINLDIEFANKGGRVEVLVFNKDKSEYTPMTPSEAHDECSGDRMAMVDVYDVGFFKWICENVVPSYIIPMKYAEYWKRDRLFYPDVIKWLAWFEDNKRLDYEDKASYTVGTSGEVDTWNCKQSGVSDCCDCEEYFNRGGARIYSAMSEWYDNVQSAISINNQVISGAEECFIPTMILPTELQVSIDDMGEFSIFSSEYELGIDYRVASGLTANENTNTGTVVTMSGMSMILSEGSGFTFDETYMEKLPSGFTSYTDMYLDNNRDEFIVSSITYFTYDHDNVKYISSAASIDVAEDDLKEQMSRKYPLEISENGWILIDGELIPINESESGTYVNTNKYLSGKTYMVLREEGTNTPYTYINGTKIYGDFDDNKMKFTFPFFNEEYKRFPSTAITDLLYITYDGGIYEIDADSGLTIDDVDYYRISGYTRDDNNEMIYLTEEGNLISGETQQEVPSEAAEVSESTVIVNYPYPIEIYAIDEIRGSTVSKLADLRLYNVLVDDIGNDIDGIYNPNAVIFENEKGYDETKIEYALIVNDSISVFETEEDRAIAEEELPEGTTYEEKNCNTITNHQPPQGTELELIYQVGNTANIRRFSKTEEDLDDVKAKGNKNYFVGDIITNMKFYYNEYDETEPNDTIVDVTLNDSGKTEIRSGSTLEIVTDDASGYTSLSAITLSTREKELLESDSADTHVFSDDIYCDITYYIGATLVRKEGENYNLCYEDGMNNHGVEYHETVRFVKENREYYLQKPSKIDEVIPMERNEVYVHSISYPIYVYKLTQEMTHVDNSQYDSSYEVAMADFKFNIDVFKLNGDNVVDTFSEKFSGDMETRNGMEVFPIFREEYKLGISSLENIDSDIYIDRGVNPSFEKHLKLGEVRTMDALLQYGLNFFKVMDN